MTDEGTTMAGDNPYEASRAPLRAIGVRSGRREDLREIAFYQKAILICILLQMILIASRLALPPGIGVLASLGLLVTGLAAMGFVIFLAVKVYSTALGILLGLLAAIPCLGLLVLLMINAKATNILRENGIPVGLLGADMSRS
jgi:hypothetical protein